MQLTPALQAFSMFLPKDTLEFFNIISSEKTDTEINIILEEKNHPPIKDKHQNLSVRSKDFTDITIEDFPARGRRVSLTFRRRRWQVGDEIIKRDIPIALLGTKLEKEFALFLKERS